VTMEVTASFAGHFKYGEWLPLSVSLANDGPAVYAEVRADSTSAGDQTTYVAPVELPAGARKRLTLYVRPASFAKAMRVRLVEVSPPGSRRPSGAGKEGRLLDTQTVDLTVERNTNYLVGVLASRPQAFTILGGLTLNPAPEEQAFKGPPQYSRPVKTIPISLADLPDRSEGLRALDALVLSGVDTSELSPEQGRALQNWVEQGGRLVLGGGAAAARTQAGLPEALVQAMRPAGELEDVMSLDGLERFAGEEVRTPGPFTVAWPSAGQALVEQDGRALVVEERLGDGRVSYVALDLAASPFDAWAGTAAFWEKLLTPGSAYPSNASPDVSPRASRVSSMAYPLQNLPALALPSLRWLAGLLALYILLVGPLNYVVLRRLRRLGWGWVTIPTVTLLFSAGAFAFAYEVRGGDVIINKISVITFGQDQQPMETFVGLFSPARRAYTLSFPGQALLAPLVTENNPWGQGGSASYAGAEIVEGEPVQLRDVQVEQWAMQAFYVESPRPAGWAIEADLTVESGRIRGTLTNRASEAIEDAVLVQGNRCLQLGDLPPGQTVTVDQALPASTSGQPFPYSLFETAFVGPGVPSRELQVRQQLLSSYFQGPNGPAQPPSYSTLIGWMQSSPLEVQVAGARWATQQTSLAIAPLRVHYAAGHVRLAPGDLTPRLIRIQGEVGECGPGGQVYTGSGQAMLEYRLPEGLAGLRVTRLALVIDGGGVPMPTIEVADREGEWVEIEIDSPKSGRNELANPARFVAADGTVRLRLTADGSGGQGGVCVGYRLDIEGEL
jgi:hypothetical protein